MAQNPWQLARLQPTGATWTGQVINGCCSKKIHGTWTNAHPTISLSFVLRKQAGWH
jgi:hypothetical protein